jgi:hypothetical protein
MVASLILLGVPPGATPSLDLDDDAQVVVHRIHLVSNAPDALVAEEHRAPDLLQRGFPRLHLAAQFDEAGFQH